MYKLYALLLVVISLSDFILFKVVYPILKRRDKLGKAIDTFNFWPLLFFYPLYSVGVTFFVMIPVLVLSLGSIQTFFLGTLFGFVTYGVYTLKNEATISEWPLIITVMEMVWGAILVGSSSLLALHLYRLFPTFF